MTTSAINKIQNAINEKLRDKHAEILYKGLVTSNKCPNCNFQISYSEYFYQLSKYTEAKKRLHKLKKLDQNKENISHRIDIQFEEYQIGLWKYFYCRMICPDCKKKYNPTNKHTESPTCNVRNFQLIEKGIFDESH